MMIVAAPAKVNLFLHVGPVQENGRHPLDSLVVFADGRVADQLHFTAAEAFTLQVRGDTAGELETAEDNLVLAAARALQAASGVSSGAAITLEKNLPVAAGIGGGSADAGAALRGLSALWNVPLDVARTIAPSLGGDVPVSLMGTPAMMRGEGEQLTPVKLPAGLPALLVNPGAACPTGPVFQDFDAAGGGGEFSLQPFPDFQAGDEGRIALINWLSVQANDLQAAAIARVPVIGDVLDALEDVDGALLSRMSGSGATCFALFETMADAQAGAIALQTARPDWWVRATELDGAI